MGWDDITFTKPTDKQIKYAEHLMEVVYGDVISDVSRMSKSEVSHVIDDLRHKVNNNSIHMNPRCKR
jgi:hypothetical protein